MNEDPIRVAIAIMPAGPDPEKHVLPVIGIYVMDPIGPGHYRTVHRDTHYISGGCSPVDNEGIDLTYIKQTWPSGLHLPAVLKKCSESSMSAWMFVHALDKHLAKMQPNRPVEFILHNAESDLKFLSAHCVSASEHLRHIVNGCASPFDGRRIFDLATDYDMEVALRRRFSGWGTGGPYLMGGAPVQIAECMALLRQTAVEAQRPRSDVQTSAWKNSIAYVMIPLTIFGIALVILLKLIKTV